MIKTKINTIFLDEKGKIIERRTHTGFYYNVLNINLKMIEIPASTFWMGSEPIEGSLTNECPQHNVTIPSFSISQIPITERQWLFVSNLPVERLKLNPYPNRPYPYIAKIDYPVANISWFDAIEFCARLSRYTGKQYRLPTEAEWEYACRGINISQVTQSKWNEKYNNPFHFGKTISSKYANYYVLDRYAKEPLGECLMSLAEARGYIPNAFGLYCMHGNVWEWCLDIWHDNYINAPKNSNVWHEEKEHLYKDLLSNLAALLECESTLRVLRGGSWISSPWDCRSASRTFAKATTNCAAVGFRVVSNQTR